MRTAGHKDGSLKLIQYWPFDMVTKKIISSKLKQIFAKCLQDYNIDTLRKDILNLQISKCFFTPVSQRCNIALKTHKTEEKTPDILLQGRLQS